MKFFLDSANLDDLHKAMDWGIIDGVTTNPSLIAKEGVPLEDRIRQICDIIPGDVSAEVISTDAHGMLAEGRHLASLRPNVVVKIPLIPDGIKAVSQLSREGIRTNVTLCFSAAQALLAAKAGASMVSPFIGRLDDLGSSGVTLIRDIVAIYSAHVFKTEVLAASIRGAHHVVEAAKAGAQIATMSLKTLEQLFHHPLTEKGLEQFLLDHHAAFQMANA